MFQIVTQKGWIEVMMDSMEKASISQIRFLIAIYFVFYHLFINMVCTVLLCCSCCLLALPFALAICIN